MSNLAASNTEQSLQEDIYRALSSLLSFVRNFCLLLSKYIRRAINFISRNPNKPHEILPSTITLASDQSSSLFLSLPRDVILNCLARIPRQNYPIISHVSKSFRSLVLSPELRQMRFLIGKDYPIFYICFNECRDKNQKYHWFSFDPNKKTTSDLNLMRVLSQEKLHFCSSVSIGSKIYFVGGYKHTSQNLWIFDSWSGELCKGPNMKVGRMFLGVAVVNGKLYVIGGGYCQVKIHVEVFDPKTQTWEFGPVNPHGELLYEAIVTEVVSVEEKIYGMSHGNGSMIMYDTKDGRYETFAMPYHEHTWRSTVCVINNMMYVYYSGHGLMWYESKDELWRNVQGLNELINESIEIVKMVECKGKLGFLWENRIKTWRCPMIVLDRNGVEIHGTIEWSVLVKYVSFPYFIQHCLSVSD